MCSMRDSATGGQRSNSYLYNRGKWELDEGVAGGEAVTVVGPHIRYPFCLVWSLAIHRRAETETGLMARGGLGS